MKRLGADVAIDYRNTRFEDVARDCDVVLDGAGGETLVRSFACVKPGGPVVSIGGTPSADRVYPLDPVREALAYCESGRATGKVVVKVS